MVDSDTTGGNYYKKTDCKKFLNIPQAVTKFDEDLDLIGNDENREVGDFLSKHSVTPDTLTGSQFQSARNVANYGTCAKYELIHHDPELSKEWRMNKTEAQKRLVDKLETDPETNTQTQLAVVASDYQTSPLGP